MLRNWYLCVAWSPRPL